MSTITMARINDDPEQHACFNRPRVAINAEVARATRTDHLLNCLGAIIVGVAHDQPRSAQEDIARYLDALAGEIRSGLRAEGSA